MPTPGFGTPATSAPAFGQTNTAPAFGGFGSAPATSAPTFSCFGQAQNAVQPFGATSTAPTFGATSTAPAFGGFGGAVTSSAPSFNFGTSTAGAFGTQTTSSLFGGSGFGTTSTAPSTGFGGFGTSFGSNFGKPAQPPAFGGFGTSTGFGQPTNQFGQPLQQQPQQPALTPEQIFLQSIYNVSIFGDERDTSIARWNYLQAQWGSGGKAFYSQTNPPVDIEPQNQLCRFKTMGYSRLPGKENKLGLVALKFGRSVSQIK